MRHQDERFALTSNLIVNTKTSKSLINSLVWSSVKKFRFMQIHGQVIYSIMSFYLFSISLSGNLAPCLCMDCFGGEACDWYQLPLSLHTLYWGSLALWDAVNMLSFLNGCFMCLFIDHSGWHIFIRRHRLCLCSLSRDPHYQCLVWTLDHKHGCQPTIF